MPGLEIVAADVELFDSPPARERGCHGVWVGVEPGNEAALATSRAAGASEPHGALVLEWPLRA